MEQPVLLAHPLHYDAAERERYAPYVRSGLYDVFRKNVPPDRMDETIGVQSAYLPETTTWAQLLALLEPVEGSLRIPDRGAMQVVSLFLFGALHRADLSFVDLPGQARRPYPAGREPALVALVGDISVCGELVSKLSRHWEGTGWAEMRVYSNMERFFDDAESFSGRRVMAVFDGSSDTWRRTGLGEVGPAAERARALLPGMETFVVMRHDDGGSAHRAWLRRFIRPLRAWGYETEFPAADIADEMNRLWYHDPYADALEAVSNLTVASATVSRLNEVSYALRSSQPGLPNAFRDQIHAWVHENLARRLAGHFAS